jgi:hypothetical protein
VRYSLWYNVLDVWPAGGLKAEELSVPPLNTKFSPKFDKIFRDFIQ